MTQFDTPKLYKTVGPPGPQYIDTHAHIHFSNYAGTIDSVLAAAEEAGVRRLITVGVSTDDSRKAVAIASQYAGVWASVGIHPHEAGEAVQGISYIRDLSTHRKVVAIGECGLDLYKSQTPLDQQVSALRLQVELAAERGLPLIFHVRDAFEEFFKIMKDYPGLPSVVHSFTGKRQELDTIMENGWMIAVNGIVTFSKDADFIEMVRSIRSDRLLLETDCPFLSPVPYRGKQNQPSRISDIAAVVSELRREPVAALARTSSENAERLFKLTM